MEGEVNGGALPEDRARVTISMLSAGNVTWQVIAYGETPEDARAAAFDTHMKLDQEFGPSNDEVRERQDKATKRK